MPFLLGALLVLFRLFDPPGAGGRVNPQGLADEGSAAWALILLATVYCLFPIYFMLVQSLKTAQEDVFGNPLIVLHPTLENFEELFEREGSARGFVGTALHRSYPFLDWLENTLVVFTGTRGPDPGAEHRRRLRPRPAAPPGLPVVAARRSSPPTSSRRPSSSSPSTRS